MFLTDEELYDLTGYQRRADQRAWLTARRWIFEVAANGRPVVHRAHAEQMLTTAKEPPAGKTPWRPHLEAFGKAA